MIRILTSDWGAAIRITADGQLAGDSVDVLEAFTKQALRQDRPVHLYLRDVSYIDQRGLELLRRLAVGGVGLSALGVYSGYIVAGIKQEQSENSRSRLASGASVAESQHVPRQPTEAA